MILAANHSGDSDNTAAITGNLMEALLGEGAIPPRCLERAELRKEIAQLADDLESAGRRPPGRRYHMGQIARLMIEPSLYHRFYSILGERFLDAPDLPHKLPGQRSID